jgi:hypothetical protein
MKKVANDTAAKTMDVQLNALAVALTPPEQRL